jgi:segregation and condensation protein B
LTSRRGPGVYGHLKLLEELGFIEAHPVGKTKSYRTTPAFAEYFGLSSDPQIMKQQLTKQARRIPPPKAPTG